MFDDYVGAWRKTGEVPLKELELGSDPNHNPLFLWVRDYISTALSTSYLTVGILSHIVFTIHALVMVALFEHFFKEYARNPSVASIFDPLDLIVSMSYRSYISMSMSGYETPMDITYQFYTAVVAAATLLYAHLPNDVEVLSALHSVLYYGDVLFRGPQAEEQNKRFDSPSASEVEQRFTEAELKLSQPMSVTQKIDVNVAYLMQRAPKAASKLSVLQQMAHARDRSNWIGFPQVLKNLERWVLLLYFGGWLPFKIWANTGVTIAILVYPFVSSFLWGVPIQRAWMGSVLSPNRDVIIGWHESWLERFIQHVELVYPLTTSSD